VLVRASYKPQASRSAVLRDLFLFWLTYVLLVYQQHINHLLKMVERVCSHPFGREALLKQIKTFHFTFRTPPKMPSRGHPLTVEFLPKVHFHPSLPTRHPSLSGAHTVF
jgi:hypothetical protein